MIRDLIHMNRSYRRFYEEIPIDIETLYELIDCARLSPSMKNLQPLRYIIINSDKVKEKIFPLIKWAGYLKEWKGPDNGERPCSYILVLGDINIADSCIYDLGFACQSILLGAIEKGYGGCILKGIKKETIKAILGISEQYEILTLIALGKPKETVILQDVELNGDVRYWRDNDDNHYVPKRKLKDIIIDIFDKN